MKFSVKLFVALQAILLLLLAGTARADTLPPLSVYGELPLVEDAAISDSGNFIAFLARVKGQRTLLVLDSQLKARTSFVIGEAKIRSIRFIGDESVLVMKSTTEDLKSYFIADKLEVYRALVLPLASDREPFYVFADQRKIENGIFGNFGIRRTSKGWTGYFGGLELRRNAGSREVQLFSGRPDLYAVNLRTNKAKRVLRSASEGNFGSWEIGPDGNPVATYEIDGKSGDWSIENSSGQEIVTGRNPTGRGGLIGLGKDGDSIIYTSEDADGQNTSRYEVPLDGNGSPVEILGDVPVNRMYFNRTSGRLMGYLRGGRSPRPIFFDPEIDKAAKSIRRAFPGKQMRMVEWTPDFKHVLVRTSGNGDAGSWFLVNVANLEAKFVAAERPAIPSEMVGAISSVKYTTADGLRTNGILTLPPGKEPKNLPAIVLPHGGPHAHDIVDFDWMAQAFASRGYAVFQPNFRGSTNRGASFRRASYGEWGRKMQSDISDGLAELVKIGIVDPDRACIMGASYGGYAALAGVTLQQGLYKCAVAVAPVSDLKMLKASEMRESGRSRLLGRSLDAELGPESEFKAHSPRQNAERADAPVLLIHGLDDTVVLFEQSAKMADALDDAGKPFELVKLDGEDHWLSRSTTRKQMLDAAMKFVQTHNPAD